jgi:predicted anti-sigma-YlaC factor YlaD
MKSLLVTIVLLMATAGCSVKKYAIRKMGDSLAGSGSTFSSDDDPELIRSAAPFSMKLLETLLAEDPKNKNLLLAATKGFTQYSYAFVQEDAEETEDKVAAQTLRNRATKLYLRAKAYGMRGLEVKHPGFAEKLHANPKEAVQVLTKAEVPLIYWTGVSWVAALAVSRDMFMLPQTPQFEALMARALELDDTYDKGAIHSFYILYEMNRITGAKSDKAAEAKMHFDRAMQLGGGHQAGPLVAYADTVCVAQGNKTEFVALLDQALKIDVSAEPDYRLVNLVAKRRARWLIHNTDKLFPKR